MKEENYETCGSFIRKSREAKNMDVADLAMALKNVKINEKVIKAWENSKDYPDLDTCWKIAYVLEIDPTKLLKLRDNERKKFVAKKPKKRTIFNSEVPDEFFWALKGVLGLVLILFAFYLVYIAKKLEFAVTNGGIEEFQEVLVDSVENGVNGIYNENLNIVE